MSVLFSLSVNDRTDSKNTTGKDSLDNRTRSCYYFVIMANSYEQIMKKDFLIKRSQMKSLLTKENFKGRWFELTQRYLRYSDGSLEVMYVHY